MGKLMTWRITEITVTFQRTNARGRRSVAARRRALDRGNERSAQKILRGLRERGYSRLSTEADQGVINRTVSARVDIPTKTRQTELIARRVVARLLGKVRSHWNEDTFYATATYEDETGKKTFRTVARRQAVPVRFRNV